MKKALFVLISITGLLFTSKAQLVAKPKCGTFIIDILDGKVNGLKPSATIADIKAKLPCFTASEAEGTAATCGASVFFTDKNIYFYTDRDYIEIKEKFQGKLTIPVMGAVRNSLFTSLGNPKLKDENWDAYQTAYGLLILHYNKAGKVNLVQMTTKSTETLSLCE